MRPLVRTTTALAAPALATAITVALSACGTRVSIGELDPGPLDPIEAGIGADTGTPRPIADAAPAEAATDAGGYVPCASKACGASCTICPPGDPMCFETAVIKHCDQNGECNAGPPPAACPPPDGGGYDPCAGKKCGASCTICNPADIGCVETAVLKNCTVAGVCSAGASGC